MTVVLTVSAILFGVLAYFQLPVNDLPAVDYPVIQVTVGYPGASPETVASNIATPLERQFMQIPGLELITSRSSQGFCLVLQFALARGLTRRRRTCRRRSVGRRGICRSICPVRRRLPRPIPTTSRFCTSVWSAIR